MTIENIENHTAYTCKCGGVKFALLKSGAIECNKCSTPLDDVKWWAGGMGAQLARAIKAEAERDALKAAMPVGELTDEQILDAEKWAAIGATGRDDLTIRTARAVLAAASSQPVPTVPDNMQDWKGMDGAIAFHLIERHADNWSDTGKMMGEWLSANQGSQPVREPLTDECRIELVTAIHMLASDFENVIGAFLHDEEAFTKAEGDIAHARAVAAKWNWNGITKKGAPCAAKEQTP